MTQPAARTVGCGRREFLAALGAATVMQGCALRRGVGSLSDVGQRLEKELLEDIVPFWERHSVDREFGGFLTCLDRDGSVYDTFKHLWMQWREVYMFAALWNAGYREHRYLDLAEHGFRFLWRHGRRSDGSYHYMLDRKGGVISDTDGGQEAFTESFAAIGCAELYKATHDEKYRREALSAYGIYRRNTASGSGRYDLLAYPMIELNVLQVMRGAFGGYDSEIAACIRRMRRFAHPESGVMFERMKGSGEFDLDTQYGRFVNPGHALEGLSFVMNWLDESPDVELREFALRETRIMGEFGIDAHDDGVWYFRDALGKPMSRHEYFLKAWWPQCEAASAMLHAHALSGDGWYLDRFRRIDDFCTRSLRDPKYGEWFAYAPVEGRAHHAYKGSRFKGFFHIPRHLLTCIRICRNGVLGALLVALSCPCAAQADVVLVKDSVACAEVVVPDDSWDAESYAAEELVHFLHKSTGVELPIVHDGEATQGRAKVLIGRAAGIGGLPPWNGRVVSGEGELKIAGGDDKAFSRKANGRACGTLYAVYEFLDRELRLRFLWPDDDGGGTAIDVRKTVVIGDCDYAYRPPFESVNIRHLPAEYARRAARVVEDSVHYPEKTRGHAFVDWWKRYGETHPDFFEMLNGRRNVQAGTSMCVANPAFHEEIVRIWRAAREMNPHVRYSINACENDTAGRCTCPMCRAWDDPEADPAKDVSARYARYYGALYDLAAKIDPSVRVFGYAYANYKNPPRGVKLPENVNISYVPDSDHPFDDATRERVLGGIRGWQKTGCTLNYRPNLLDGYAMPHEISADYYAEFQEMRKARMKRIDVDGPNPTFGTQGPFLYILCRMMVRPDMTLDGLMDEYCDAFGPAKGAVRDYWNFWGRYVMDHAGDFHEVPEEHNRLFHSIHYGFQYAFYAHILFPERILWESAQYLRRARELAKDSPDHLRRVEFLIAGLRHAILCSRTCAICADESARNPERQAAIDAVHEFRKTAPAWSFNPKGYAFRPWINEPAAWTLHEIDPERVVKIPVKWRVKTDPDDRGLLLGYDKADFDDSAWEWGLTDRYLENQGFGRGYLHAWYRTVIDVPVKFADCKTTIRFGRVDESCRVFINGKEAASFVWNPRKDHNTMNYPMSFDVTGFVKAGERNVVSVKLTNQSGNGGLWQPVELRFE